MTTVEQAQAVTVPAATVTVAVAELTRLATDLAVEAQYLAADAVTDHLDPTAAVIRRYRLEIVRDRIGRVTATATELGGAL